ncbi:CLUMA_CG021352, isoform A [Clunio marinus]|uniref:CLUMA_CG021352, isoform A n=1 Tax=Clunio marinus TaxID=568069 RepID=A0A1J1J7G4_9DIPT|nr:CLUMA_CG021352, isoform A [Clunio marinus]
MKIEFVILLVLSLLVTSSIAQANNRDGPCGQWRPGDADLGTWDIIREFQMDNYESRYEIISRTEGSNSFQTAYRLENSANFSMRAEDAFPRGTPFEFSFECTYRERQRQPDPWHLFHLTNSNEESQLSVTLNPGKETLQLSLPDAKGDLQMVEFHSTRLFDQRWHKIMLGVTESQAKLWVDCQPVKSVQGYYDSPLRERGQYDIHDGTLSIAQVSKVPSYQSAPPIDLQWMVMTCDPSRPLRQNCDEIPGYDVAGVAPEFLEGPEPKPCQVCPRGPQGLNGTDGRPGQKGERGFPGPIGPMGIPGFSPPAVKGEKGEQGLRGFDGRDGAAGRNGVPGLRGDRGERGFPGLPGLPGTGGTGGSVVVREGQKGERGEIGLMGLQGERGERGESGSDGRPGYDGVKGEKGEVGLRGFDGRPGPQGPSGPPGPPGESSGGHSRGMGVHYVLGGGTGARGEPGPQGQRGQQGPPGENGQPGRSFSEEEVREICYSVLRNQLEELTANLQGPQGPPGQPGKRGPQGSQGDQGQQGEKGRQGYQGIQGLPGMPGPHGEAGYPGEPGERGEKGDRGEEGIGRQGPPGPQGPTGATGADGMTGNPGRPGPQGEQGSTGNVGPRGPPGSAGQCPVDCYQAMTQANALYYSRAQGNQKGP